jgi:phospholipase C
MRRRFLFVLAVTLISGCSDDQTTSSGHGGSSTTDSTTGPSSTVGMAGAEPNGTTTSLDPTTSASTGAGGAPFDPMPIKSVVVIVKENHTFDSYFTGFPGADTTMTAKLSDGSTITRQPMPSGPLACDITHSNSGAVKAWANGAMNGFDTNTWSCKSQDPVLPFRYFTEAQIPNYWAWAKEYVIGDRFFSTLKGPTTPGHLTVVAAETPFFGNTPSAMGCASDPPPTIDTAYNRQTCKVRDPVPACFDIPSVVDDMPADKSWRAYGPPAVNGNINTPLNFIQHVGGDAAVRAAHFRDLHELLGDLKAGDQADLIFAHVYSGTYTGIAGEQDNSEHPAVDPCWGENYTVMLVDAIMQGPRWKETAIIVTYDDWGGFYDHVAPKPEACDLYTPGFRLPIMIISPYAKKGFVLHEDSQGLTQEHASIPKLIEDVFGLPRMQSKYVNARDGQAGSLMEAFDFEQPPRDPKILKTRTCQ